MTRSEIGALYHAVICEKGERARQLAVGAFSRFLGGLQASAARPTRWSQPRRPSASLGDVGPLIDQARLIAGNPEEVADMLCYLRSEVGFTHVNLMFQFGGLGFDVAQQSMALFAEQVMPRVRMASDVLDGTNSASAGRAATTPALG